jgi:thioredoxin-related protein
MTALNMHGNQFINQSNSLAESLNVKGIPHFLIYDKEGKLYQYQAPRPSTGDTLKNLLESLQ